MSLTETDVVYVVKNLKVGEIILHLSMAKCVAISAITKS